MDGLGNLAKLDDLFFGEAAWGLTKFRLDIGSRTGRQHGFYGLNVFLPNCNVKWSFTHIANCIDVSAMSNKQKCSFSVFAPKKNMKRCIAINVSATNINRTFSQVFRKQTIRCRLQNLV